MPTMGAALEAVPLRSTLPTGRLTMRYQIPSYYSPELHGDVLARRTLVTTSTTPKVPESTAVAADVDGETAARKGGEAR